MKHIIFCLPGAPTLHAAESWDDLRSAFAGRPDLRMSINRGGGSSVRHVRNQLLEVGVTGPKRLAKPFGGQDYDFIMWIDSDSVYRPEDFFRLLDLDLDIASGAVPIDLEPGRVAAGKIDMATGRTAYLKMATLSAAPIEVEWVGFAFLLVKRGVFEALSYPWFSSRLYTIGGQIVDPSEDICWSLGVREKGFRIVLDPLVRIGHEKLVIMEGPPAPAPATASLLERFIDRYDRAWRMSAPALQALRELLEERKPKKVLELGPGASSFVVLPWCLEHGALYRGLDHTGPWADKHWANLREAGIASIESNYSVHLDQSTKWYCLIPPDIEQQAPYDLIIVDGPVEGRGCPRALMAYERWSHEKTAWIIDDVHREGERKLANHIVNALRLHGWINFIQDPDYPRKTALLRPAIDGGRAVSHTEGQNQDAEAIGPTASKGQPEAIA